ncbi:hypothetical protein [Leucobacter sp.]
MAVTVSVVLLTFDGSGAISGDLQRVVITVAAGAATAAAVSVAAALLLRAQFE